MEKKFTTKFIEVEQDIYITGDCISEILEKFKRFINCSILNISEAILCTIDYVVKNYETEYGPINIYFLDGTRVRLDLKSGYGGVNPNDVCKILTICEFDFDEENILVQEEIVDIKYHKNIVNNTIYQFKNMDGSYEYYGM